MNDLPVEPQGCKKNHQIAKNSFTVRHESPNLLQAYQNPPLHNSMKNKLSLLVGLASLAAIVGVQAQTAVTDPVGYVTATVNPSPAGSRFTAISPTLVNKTEFSGVVASVAGNVLTLTGTPLTGLNFAPVGGFSKYWVEITNGATTEGAWTNITSNTDGTITTTDNMASAIVGGTTTIKVRAHVTIDQFLGATNTAGLQGGEDPGSADEVLLIDPTAVAKIQTVFYDTAAGAWTDGDSFNVVGAQPIEPGQGVLVKRKSNTARSIVVTGYVKTGKTMVSSFQGTNLLGVPLATGTSFASSNLFTGANLATSVQGGEDPGSADEVLVIPPSGVIQTIFYDTAAGAWTDGDTFNPVPTQVLAEATGFLIKRKSATPFTWTAPAQVIAP